MMMKLLTLWKPIAAAFLAGAMFGGYTTHKFTSTFRTAQAVRQADKKVAVRAAEAIRREVIADQHEADREAIDRQTEATGDELERYLRARTDVRDLDLGAEWLCIIDRTAGRAAPRCPSELAAAVPSTSGAARRVGRRSPAGVAASDTALPNMQQPTRATESSDGENPAPDPTSQKQ